MRFNSQRKGGKREVYELEKGKCQRGEKCCLEFKKKKVSGKRRKKSAPGRFSSVPSPGRESISLFGSTILIREEEKGSCKGRVFQGAAQKD